MSLSKAEIARRKEAQRIAKSKDREMRALEVRLVREGRIYPRAHYRPRGTFRAIVAIALAFFLGIFAGLGGLAGAGVFVASSVKLDSIKGIEKWIDSDYTNMTLLDFISTVSNDLKGGVNNIGQIAKFTPAVDRLLDILSKNMDDLGIDFDDAMREKFKTTSFEKIGEFFMEDVVKSAELGKIAKVDANSDAILLALCYGEEGIDYDLDENGNIVPREGHTPTKVNDLMDSPTETLNSIRLGTIMGLNKDVTDKKLSDNAMMYALCYGKRGVDYEVEDSRIKVLTNKGKEQEKGENSTLAKEERTDGDGNDDYVHTFPTTLDDLMNHSNAVINSLELGTMLGLDQNSEDKKIKDQIEDNGVMYALAYGKRDVDWEYDAETESIVMRDGHDEKYPTKMEEFTKDSDSLIQGMEVETLMSIKPGSDKLMHYLAYGPEMAKGEAFVSKEGEPAVEPWKAVDGHFEDANGRRVDENGYLVDEDGNFLTESVPKKDENGNEIVDENGDKATELQYSGGGRYVYTYEKSEDGSFVLDKDGNRTISGIQMLPDPNETGTPQKLYDKKQVKDLTKEDAKILDGMKLGDVMEIDSGSSGLMKSIKDWTIEELKEQKKIESLKVADVIGEDAESNIMKAFAARGTTLGDLKDQETINSLKLNEVLNIEEDGPNKSSGILLAMKDWKISDLSNQNRIERLKLSQVLTIDDESSTIMNAMKDWRIGDLSKQEKIDSLTLGDVLKIDETSPLLLQNLATNQLGELAERVDNLRLSELLTEDEIKDNKILKNLRNSTLKTLSGDIQKLSVSEVFGDQMYSYMEIERNEKVKLLQGDGNFKEETIEKIDYDWLYKTYFGNAVSQKDDHHKYNYNYAEYNGLTADGKKDETAFVFRPTAVTPTDLTVRRVLSSDENTVVTEGYFVHTASGGQNVYTPVTDKEIYYDVIEREIDTEKVTEKVYYYENEVTLVPVYEYGVYDYEKGAVETWQELGADGKFTYNTATYDVKTDDAGEYYIEIPAAPAEGETATAEPERVDLDRRVKHYTVNGTVTEFVTKEGVTDRTKVTYNSQELLVRHASPKEGDPYDYVTEKITVERKFAARGNDTYSDGEVYDEGATKELYSDGDKQLDRYVSGVWFLLLGKKEGDTIIFETDKEILKMDESITSVSSSMQNTLLAELWFHGLIDENPYTDLTTIPKFEDGLTFKPDGQTQEHKVYNLIEVTLNETLGLVKALVSALTTTP